MRIFLRKHGEIILFSLIIILFLGISFYQLENIPGEWYGDISIVNTYVLSILNFNWPFSFILSAGPLYHYLIAPIIYLLGVSFFSYKIASVMVGTGSIVACYLFAKTVSKSAFVALTAALILSTSFWFIAFARLGNSQILIPFLCSISVYFAYMSNVSQKKIYLFLGTIVSSLGLFLYPQTFIVPLIFLIMVLYHSLLYQRKNIFRTISVFLLGFLPGITFFLFIIARQTENFSTGYIGSKIWMSGSLITIISNFASNYLKTLGMFFIKGDIAFRTNVPNSPELDRISAIFFICGILYIFLKKRNLFLYILFPILVLVLPSLAFGIPPIEIPSQSRTIGILPFVAITIAFGILFVIERLRNKKIQISVYAICLGGIFLLNFFKYFFLYPKTLPNNNTPYGAIIAEYIKLLPLTTDVYFASFDWGEWGQPEPESVYFSQGILAGRENIIKATITNCYEVKSKHAAIIFDPKNEDIKTQFMNCFPNALVTTYYTKNNQEIFSVLMLK